MKALRRRVVCQNITDGPPKSEGCTELVNDIEQSSLKCMNSILLGRYVLINVSIFRPFQGSWVPRWTALSYRAGDLEAIGYG